MNKSKISRIVEVKECGSWRVSFEEYEEGLVYKALAEDLLHKKIHNCSYITRIKDDNLYNGFRKIVVFYSNDTKATYIVRN